MSSFRSRATIAKGSTRKQDLIDGEAEIKRRADPAAPPPCRSGFARRTQESRPKVISGVLRVGRVRLMAGHHRLRTAGGLQPPLGARKLSRAGAFPSFSTAARR